MRTPLLSSVDTPGRPLAAARFGARIRRLREAQDLTLSAVAGRAGVACSTVWAVERGDVVPTLRNAEKLALVLDSSLAELLLPEPEQETTRC